MASVSVKYIWAEQLEVAGCQLPGLNSSLSAERITMYTVRLNNKTVATHGQCFCQTLKRYKYLPWIKTQFKSGEVWHKWILNSVQETGLCPTPAHKLARQPNRWQHWQPHIDHYTLTSICLCESVTTTSLQLFSGHLPRWVPAHTLLKTSIHQLLYNCFLVTYLAEFPHTLCWKHQSINFFTTVF